MEIHWASEVMQEDELLLKRRIQERVERMKLDGPQVLKILVDACQPGAKSLDETQLFSGTHCFPSFFLVAAPFKMVFQKKGSNSFFFRGH